MEQVFADNLKLIIDFAMSHGLGLYVNLFAALELAAQTAAMLWQRRGHVPAGTVESADVEDADGGDDGHWDGGGYYRRGPQ
jgi:hypothetical protein